MPDLLHAPSLGRMWHCDPQGIICEHEHLLAFYKTGYRADLREMTGHAFLQCRDCEPHTQFLAVFVREPSPLVLCYSLSIDSYREWDGRAGRTPPTAELLYLIRDPEGRSHNPQYRPTKARRT